MLSHKGGDKVLRIVAPGTFVLKLRKGELQSDSERDRCLSVSLQAEPSCWLRWLRQVSPSPPHPPPGA